MKKTIIISILLSLVATLSGCGAETKQEPLKPVEKLAVQTIQITPVETQKTLSLSGEVVADKKISIVSPFNDVVGEVFVDVGEKVAENEALATLLGETVLQNVENARRSLVNARQNTILTQLSGTLNRQQAENNLQKAQQSANSAQEAYINTLKTASATLKEADANLKKTLINSDITIESVEVSYANTRKSTAQQLDAINELLTQTARNALTALEPLMENADNILGIQDTTINDSFESYLGVRDINQFYATRDQFKRSAKALQEAQNDFKQNNDPQKYMASITDAAKAIKTLMDGLGVTLRNSVVNVNLSEQLITQLKAQTASGQSTANAALQSLEQTNQQHTAVKISANQQLNDAKAALDRAQERKGGKEETATIMAARAQYEKTKTQLQEQIQQSKKTLDFANIDLENARKNVDLITNGQQSQIITAKNQEDVSAGQLALTMIQEKDLVISAPFSGVITQKFVDSGARITTGTKLLELANLDTLKIEANINPNDALYLEVGQIVMIENNIEGEIIRIAPSVDDQSRKVRMEIRIPEDAKLMAGTFVAMEIPVKNNVRKIAIPLKSVYITESEKYVFVIENETIQKKVMEIGRIMGDRVEIQSGLNIGDKVVLERGEHIHEDVEAVATN